MQHGGGYKGTGRVIRIGQEQHARVGLDGSKHCIKIVAEMFRGYFDPCCADGLGHQWINGKRVLRIEGGRTCRQKSTSGQFQYVVRAIA